MKLIRFRTTLLLSAATAAAGIAHATPLGLATDPLGDTAAGTVGFAHWDTYPGLNFTADAADTFDADVFTASLSAALSGGMVLGGGDRLYSGSGPTPHAFDLTLSLTEVRALTSVSLQLKFTTPSGGLLPADFFTITSELGATPAAFVLGTSVESQTFNLVQWTWTGLSVGAGGTLTFSLTSPANHVSLDGLRLDAAAIPEPSTYAVLLGLLAAAFALLPRRRAA